jgi:AcrR family transcriptional regulator
MNEHWPGRGRSGYHHGDLRQALLKAAEEELKEKGVEGFTLRSCAKRAGVSHAAPAHHFKDANALLTALAAVGFARFNATLEARRARAGQDPEARLLALGLGYIAFATAEPALFRLMFSSDRPDFSDPTLGAAGCAAHTLLVDAVTAVTGAASPCEETCMRDVAAAWAMVHGIADLVLSGRLRWLCDRSPADREKVYRDLIARIVPQPRR